MAVDPLDVIHKRMRLLPLPPRCGLHARLHLPRMAQDACKVSCGSLVCMSRTNDWNWSTFVSARAASKGSPVFS